MSLQGYPLTTNDEHLISQENLDDKTHKCSETSDMLRKNVIRF